MAPGLTAGWTALAGVSFGHRRAAPTVRVGLANAVPQPVAGREGTATFAWVAAVAEACPIAVVILSRGRAWTCATGEYGVVRAAGSDTLNPAAVSRPWVAAGAKIRLSWRLLGPLSVEGSAGGLFAFERDRFTLASEDVFETPEVVARATLGLGLDLP